MSPDGTQGMTVLSVGPPRSMVGASPADHLGLAGRRTCTGATRLITRVSSRYQWFSPSVAFSVLLSSATSG